MKLVNIHEAKTNFSALVNLAIKGEDIVIGRGGVPLLRLVPYEEKVTPRQGGQFLGMLMISEDFDAPLPEELLQQFNGK